jgi:hypothetical protein
MAQQGFLFLIRRFWEDDLDLAHLALFFGGFTALILFGILISVFDGYVWPTRLGDLRFWLVGLPSPPHLAGEYRGSVELHSAMDPEAGLMKVIDSFDVLGLLVFVRFVALVDRWSSPQTCKWSCTWMQQILKRAKGLTKLHTGSKPGFSVGAASVGKRSIRN